MKSVIKHAFLLTCALQAGFASALKVDKLTLPPDLRIGPMSFPDTVRDTQVPGWVYDPVTKQEFMVMNAVVWAKDKENGHDNTFIALVNRENPQGSYLLLKDPQPVHWSYGGSVPASVASQVDAGTLSQSWLRATSTGTQVIGGIRYGYASDGTMTSSATYYDFRDGTWNPIDFLPGEKTAVVNVMTQASGENRFLVSNAVRADINDGYEMKQAIYSDHTQQIEPFETGSKPDKAVLFSSARDYRQPEMFYLNVVNWYVDRAVNEPDMDTFFRCNSTTPVRCDGTAGQYVMTCPYNNGTLEIAVQESERTVAWDGKQQFREPLPDQPFNARFVANYRGSWLEGEQCDGSFIAWLYEYILGVDMESKKLYPTSSKYVVDYVNQKISGEKLPDNLAFGAPITRDGVYILPAIYDDYKKPASIYFLQFTAQEKQEMLRSANKYKNEPERTHASAR